LKDKQDTGGGGRRNCLISVSVRVAWPERAVVSSEKLLPAFWTLPAASPATGSCQKRNRGAR